MLLCDDNAEIQLRLSIQSRFQFVTKKQKIKYYPNLTCLRYQGKPCTNIATARQIASSALFKMRSSAAILCQWREEASW